MSHGRRGFRFDGRSFLGVVSAAAVSTRTNTPVCNAPGLFGDAYGGESFSYCLFVCLCSAAKRTLAWPAPCHQVIVTLQIWLLCGNIFSSDLSSLLPSFFSSHAARSLMTEFQACGLARPAPAFVLITGRNPAPAPWRPTPFSK